jgi:hypothetical protein
VDLPSVWLVHRKDAENHPNFAMTDKELAQYVEKKINCAATMAYRIGVPLTRNGGYRVVPKLHGYQTSFYDYRRRRDNSFQYTYMIDIPLVGTRSHGDVVGDLSRIFLLPNCYLTQSIDCGFQGANYSDCYITTTLLSRSLFDLGIRLKNSNYLRR